MEEDIKILEENFKVLQSMENIIKRNHYLENEVRKTVIQELDKAKSELYKDYIPKSRIEEMIEEYKKEYADISNRNSGCLTLYREKEIELEHKIEALEELLK